MRINFDSYLVMTEKLLKLADSLSYYEELRTSSELMRSDIIPKVKKNALASD